MFLAKFSQVSSDSKKFKADKNKNLPYIGKVLAGRSSGSIYNGTMFQRDNLKENQIYACTNYSEEKDGKVFIQTEIISEVSLLDFKALSDQLGEAHLDASTPE